MASYPKKKKPKNLLILLVDVGSSEDFDKVKACAFNIYKGKLFKEKSLDQIALVIIGSEESENSANLEHISVALTPAVATWPHLKAIHYLEPSGTSGDWLGGLTVACQLLEEQSRGDSYDKVGFILISSFQSDVNQTLLPNVKTTLQKYSVDLICITSTELASLSTSHPLCYAMLGQLADLPNVEVSPIDQSLGDTELTSAEQRNAMAWNVDFMIGDLTLPVTGYKWVGKEPTGNIWNAVKDKTEHVVSSRVYTQKSDPTLPALEPDQIVRGFHYGNTIIPMTDAERSAMKYESGDRGLKLICFTPKSRIPLYLLQEDTIYVITASVKSANNSLLLSLVQQLYEEDQVAIVRQVYAKNGAPTIQVLYPVVEEAEESEDIESEASKHKYYFVMARLPYAQYMNDIKVPSLMEFSNYFSKVQDDSSPDQELSTEQVNAMQDYVQKLDLTKGAEYADDIPYLPDVARDPAIQIRTNFQIRKYLSPDEDVSEVEIAPAIRQLYEPSSRVEEAGRELREALGEVLEKKEMEVKEEGD